MKKSDIRGFIVSNNGHLYNRIEVDNTGGTTITILPTILLTSDPSVVRGLPGVSSISGVLRILSVLNTGIELVGGSAIRVSPRGMGSCIISRGVTRNVHTSDCFLNTLLNEVGGTHITPPNNYGFNMEPVSRRVGNFRVLNTGISFRGNVISTETARLYNDDVCLSIISINTAVGVVLTTTGTGKLAMVRGTTHRPRVISLTGCLGSVNTGVVNTNADIVGVHNIRGLRNAACDVVPSRVRTNACVTTTITARNSILVAGIAPGRLRSVVTGLHRANTIVARCSRTMEIAVSREPHGYGMGAVPRPNFPASVRPRVTAILTITRNADVIARNM